MDWISIVSGIFSAGAILAVIEWLRYVKKDRADVASINAEADGKSTDNALRYASKLEDRLDKVESRLGLLEARNRIFQCAVNCAYRCKHVDNPEAECPVLTNIEKNGTESDPE